MRSLVRVEYRFGGGQGDRCVVEPEGRIGYPRLVRCRGLTSAVLAEYRASGLRGLAYSFPKECPRGIEGHLCSLVREIRSSIASYGDPVKGLLARRFNEVTSRLLEENVHEPVNLEGMRMYYGVPLYRESCTRLNPVTLAIGLSICLY